MGVLRFWDQFFETVHRPHIKENFRLYRKLNKTTDFPKFPFDII